MGNNYVPMPGTYWYNPTGEQQGQYRMKVTHQCEQRSFGGNGLPVNADGTYTYTPVLLQGGKDANMV
jgi:hypothetical protein